MDPRLHSFLAARSGRPKAAGNGLYHTRLTLFVPVWDYYVRLSGRTP